MSLNLFPVTIMLKPLAYLDPGTGSMLLQMLVGSLLGGGILLKAFWGKIFKKKTSASGDDRAQDTEGIIDDETLKG